MRTQTPFLLLFGACFISQAYSQEDKLTIQVYYESLCPDSKNFITTQLYPTYEKLGKHLQVDFKPFGNAQYEPDGTGGWTFKCQHGNDECIGNLYQACLLNRLHSENQLQVEAVNCIMSDEKPNEATQKCMSSLNLSGFPEVEKCYSSNVGENLLHDFGVETNELNPEHYFIPWITFNDVWNKEDFEAALGDLYSFLCKDKLSHVPECK